jgi:hypothetical protein
MAKWSRKQVHKVMELMLCQAGFVPAMCAKQFRLLLLALAMCGCLGSLDRQARNAGRVYVWYVNCAGRAFCDMTEQQLAQAVYDTNKANRRMCDQSDQSNQPEQPNQVDMAACVGASQALKQAVDWWRRA